MKPTYESVTAKLTPEQKAAFDNAIAEAKQLITLIESKPATTKDHYGDYLHIIKSPFIYMIFSMAGANKAGIMAAAQINGI